MSAGFTMSDSSDLPASPTWRWSFLVAIVILLLSGGLAIQQYTRFAAAAALVEHTHEVLDSIDRLVTRLVDAETSHRGFLLTGDRSFLELYSHAGTDARALTVNLVALVADSPPQQARARRLAELAVARLDEMTHVLQMNTGGNPAAAIGRITGGLGTRLMDDLRVRAAEMRAAEATLLTQRANQAELAERGAMGFAVVSLLVSVALGFVAISVERSFERRRVALLAEMSARAAAERQALAAAADL
jgi:CHASE3 domain sensor protein